MTKAGHKRQRLIVATTKPLRACGTVSACCATRLREHRLLISILPGSFARRRAPWPRDEPPARMDSARLVAAQETRSHDDWAIAAERLARRPTMMLIVHATKATCRAFPHHSPAPILETFLVQRIVGILAPASTAPCRSSVLPGRVVHHRAVY